MEIKEKGRFWEIGFIVLVFAIAFLVVIGVSFAFKAALSYFQQDNLAKVPFQLAANQK